MSNDANGPQAADEAVRLNKEGGELFKAGQYEAAATRYEAAIIVDTSKSPLYFSNLAAVYLKLEKFAHAESAANTSLVRDPKAIKSRYRRAVARKQMGRLAESLIDLVNLLAISPGNAEAAAAFRETSILYGAADESNDIPLEGLAIAAAPHAFGSPTALQNRTHVTKPSPNDYHMSRVVQESIGNIGLSQTRSCATCKISKGRGEMKICRKCKRSMYCSTTCQRSDWPIHRDSCSLPEDNHLTFRLGREISSHIHFRTLLMAYGVRALGLAGSSRPTTLPARLLLVLVDMVPIAPDAVRKRLRVKHIIPVPLAVLPPDVVRDYMKVNESGPCVGVCVGTTGVYGAGDTRHCVTACPVPLPFLREDFSMALRSHSLSEDRRISLDLDLLYANIEDELSLDADNHYGMQG
ncbi:hypothetical protein C8R47DRAFT_402041 [Mycena vitilis]|nr:hypothetical protein C8R47DRAFT_402041 [Mycena vitilis]